MATASSFPKVDFAPIGRLADVYDQGKIMAARQRLGEAFKGGNLDYGEAAKILAQSGDMEGAMTFAKLGETAGYHAADQAWRQQEASRAQGNADRTFGLQMRALEGEKVPANFRRTETGVEAIPGGPADPTYIAAANAGKEKPRQFNFGDIDKLAEQGQQYSTMNNFVNTFEDKFGGYGTKTTGDIATWAGRYLPEGIAGKDIGDAAAWWQSYDAYKNVVRKELSGTAQSAQETANFERASINPGMTPKQIRENLAKQKSIVDRLTRTKASALVQSGYDPAAISSAYGINLDDIGAQTVRGPRGPTRMDAGQPPAVAAPAAGPVPPPATPLASPGQARAAPAGPTSFTRQQVIDEAREALKPRPDGSRKDPALIARKLREMGLDPREAGIE